MPKRVRDKSLDLRPEFVIGPPVFTETELVERALYFANVGTLHTYEAFASPRADYSAIDLKSGIVEPQRTVPTDVDKMQTSLIAALESIIKGRVPKGQADAWCAAASSVVTLSLFRMDGRKLRTELRYRSATQVVETMPALLSLSLCLLLDAERPFGRDLGRCEVCSAFFFVQPPKKQGRRRRRFCSDGCADEAKKRATRERAKRWYARQHK
jgi:hypothetical protein